MENLREKAINKLESEKAFLADAAHNNNADEHDYGKACGYVWAFMELDIISTREAFDWIDRMAEAYNGGKI